MFGFLNRVLLWLRLATLVVETLIGVPTHLEEE